MKILVGFAAFLLAGYAAAAPLSAPGIAVSGSGSHFFKQCSTCPDVGSFDFDSDGGDNVGAAETSAQLDPFYGWFAEGVLTGPNSLPVLKARAEAEEATATDP